MRNRKIQTVCILFFFLMALNISAQIPTRTASPKKENTETIKKPNVQDPRMKGIQNAQAKFDISKKYFKELKVGTVSQKEGQRTLKVVDDNFPEINQTKTTKVGTKVSANEICVIEKIDINVKTRNFKAFPLDGAPDWLKPGVVMNAKDFIDGNGKMEERYNRTPIVLSTDLKGVTKTFVEVINPKMRHLIRDAENTLISQKAQPINANMTFKYYEIKSLEELGFKLTGKFSAGLGTFGASLGLNYGTKKSFNYYVMEFNQHMFDIEVNSIDANNLFSDPTIPTKDYIYLSKVKYGRRGMIIFKSTKTLNELGVNASASTNVLVSKASLNTAYNELKEHEEVDIEFFFYGGTSASAINSIKKSINEKKPNIFSFIESSSADHKVALPIAYDIKNLDNQLVGLENNMSQPEYQTCIPKRDFKLKVTLLDLQCIDGRDGGGNDPDDYAIQQYIVYKTKGVPKKFASRSINLFPNRKDGPVQEANKPNILISGDSKNQLHVKQGRIRANRGNVINNSLVFNITYDEFMDPNADFKIYTWLKEYSSTDKIIHNINTPISVKIKDVLEILSGVRKLKPNTVFPDGQIGQSNDGKAGFHSFGSEYLMLDNIQKLDNRFVLEGPIRLGKSGEKAAAWITFELLD